MDKLKVCFIGVGSIARRHIRNLHTVCENRGIELSIDSVRRIAQPIDGVDMVYTDIPQGKYDAIFITNPTEMHLETLKAYQGHSKSFFIEKPVVSMPQIEQAKNFICQDDSVYYVACPLRYNAVIQWIKENVNPHDVISVRSISSSYLPEWRLGQDYRNTYSAHKDMGGGVSIDLIHEWDYLSYLFGWPERVYSLIGKKSNLDIDSDDYAIYIAEYADKIAELHLDYFGRKTIREVQLFIRDDTIVGDIANNRLSFLVSGKVIDFHEERDDFQRRELECFLDMVEGKVPVDNGFRHAIDVLELTQGRVVR